MKEIVIQVNNLSGLTSRSGAELVEEANHHECNVIMHLSNGEECDLKSIMNVFALSPVNPGDSLKIVCDGVDEENAVARFKKLSQEYQF